MKKRVSFIFGLLVIVSLLGGCGKSKKIENKIDFSKEVEDETKETNNNETEDDDLNTEVGSEVQYSYGGGIEECIDNADGTCTLKYNFENGDVALQIGFILFVNGDMQKCIIEDNKEDKYIQCVGFEANQKKVMELTFKPEISNKADKFFLRVCTMLNPETFPNSENYSYENNTKICNSFPFELSGKNVVVKPNKIKKYESVQMTDEVRELYQYTDSRGNYKDLLSRVQFEILDDNRDYRNVVDIIDKEVSCKLYGFGGKKCDYYVYAFLNNECINNEKVVYGINGEQYEVVEELNLNIENFDEIKKDKYNSFYILSCPIDGDEENEIIKTVSVVAIEK